MTGDQIEVLLKRSAEDGRPNSTEYQNELNSFSAALRAGGVDYSQRAMALDSAEASGYALGEFILQFGKDTLTVLAPALVAWLHGRSGRKIRIKKGDLEIEATKVEEVEQLLTALMTYEGRNDADGQ